MEQKQYCATRRLHQTINCCHSFQVAQMNVIVPRQTCDGPRFLERPIGCNKAYPVGREWPQRKSKGIGSDEQIGRIKSEVSVARKLLPFLLAPEDSSGVGLPHSGASVFLRAVSDFANAGDLWESQRPAVRNEKSLREKASRARTRLSFNGRARFLVWVSRAIHVLIPNCCPTSGAHLNAIHVEAGQERIKN
jgi:hypothetical protein